MRITADGTFIPESDALTPPRLVAGIPAFLLLLCWGIDYDFRHYWKR